MTEPATLSIDRRVWLASTPQGVFDVRKDPKNWFVLDLSGGVSVVGSTSVRAEAAGKKANAAIATTTRTGIRRIPRIVELLPERRRSRSTACR
jgi:hypothetical protein